VTLLGDALHNMTPYRGIGANTALRDAAALRQALRAVDRAEDDMIPALAAYEREMVDYGFRAVRESLRNMERFHAQGSLPARLHQILLPHHRRSAAAQSRILETMKCRIGVPFAAAHMTAPGR
jgi:2-polyprenyl-6-methoxyphenol hydroxylase-like FAD-dependent oxidoreductase